jgi:DNA (cytosine-5)-methyltransferase 1
MTASSTAAADTREQSQSQHPPGIPVGAVRLQAEHLQPFRTLLERTYGPIRFRGVDRIVSDDDHDDNQLLVHLPPRVVAALNERKDNDNTATFVRFLQSKGATYLRGVRRKDNNNQALPTITTTAVSSRTITGGDAKIFTFVELFAGIGGFRLGLERIGGVSVLASELSPHAAHIYQTYFGSSDNHPHDSSVCPVVIGDVLDLDLTTFPSYTMLTAGFPCQPFSNRGHQQGLEDETSGQLYLELSRILWETQPPCFLFENVVQLVLLDGGSRSERRKGAIATFTKGKVLERILQSFSSCGYQVDWNVVNSRHFLPQNRERVYIVGTRNDLGCQPFPWNRVLPTTSSTTIVRDVLESKDSPAVLASELNPSQWLKVQSTYMKKNTTASIEASINLDGKAPTLISQYHRVGSVSTKFIFQESDGTVRDGTNGTCRPRFLTPRECCRIMGFPEDFPVPVAPTEDPAHFYHGIGNAVTPPVVAAIGRELLQCVKGNVDALGSS